MREDLHDATPNYAALRVREQTADRVSMSFLDADGLSSYYCPGNSYCELHSHFYENMRLYLSCNRMQ